MKAQLVRPAPKPASVPTGLDAHSVVQRHLTFGWWSLLIFLTAGLVLEGLHGLKSQSYLGVHQEMRRLMWTLAHAHGTLLSVVNLGFAFMVYVTGQWAEKRRNLASALLRAATILMPAGFFLGGLFTYSGDPGLGILLVPIGGIFLFVAVLVTAMGVARRT
jgi:hypothetical protein